MPKKFVPKPGQADFTKVRYCPVVNVVVKNGQEVLLVHRSKELDLYPDFWNGISGFLDDQKTVEGKVYEELREELNITKDKVKTIKVGQMLVQEAPEINRTWLVFPVLATVATRDFKLDWESQDGKWFKHEEIKSLRLLPGFDEVLNSFKLL